MIVYGDKARMGSYFEQIVLVWMNSECFLVNRAIKMKGMSYYNG